MNEQNTKTPQITLTAPAMAAAQALQAENTAFSGLSLRLYLDGKGCDGFYYGVTFDAATAEDHHFSQGDIDVVVDSDTLEFVAGSTITWVDDERGKGFLVENPRHRQFRGKFYKRSVWQDRLREKVGP